MSGNIFVYLVGFFILGLILIYDGTKKYTLVKKIENVATTRVHSAAIGFSELYGTARCKEDMFSPITKNKCAYWRVIVYRRGSKGRRVEIYKNESGTPFYLQDETGKILVDPAGAQIEIPSDSSFEGSITGKTAFMLPSNKLNEIVIRYIDGLDKDAKELFERYENHYLFVTEYYIADGDGVYVLGSVEGKEGASSDIGFQNLIVKKGKYEKTMYISDKPEKKIVGGYRKTINWEVYGGFALSAICLLILLLLIGL